MRPHSDCCVGVRGGERDEGLGMPGASLVFLKIRLVA